MPRGKARRLTFRRFTPTRWRSCVPPVSGFSTMNTPKPTLWQWNCSTTGTPSSQVLHHPELPLTNNEAERALRHWVILRKLSYGTRTATGSRIFALLASVIDTCRQRGHSPWLYLQTAIADRRANRSLAPLPQ